MGSYEIKFVWFYTKIRRLLDFILVQFSATGQQEDEDGKSLVRDEREKAITFVFCRDLY